MHSLFPHNLILIWAGPGLWGGLWSAGRPGADVHFTPLQLLLTFYGGWGTLVLTKLCYLTIFSADINPSLSASARILTRPRFSQNICWPRSESSGHLADRWICVTISSMSGWQARLDSAEFTPNLQIFIDVLYAK